MQNMTVGSEGRIISDPGRFSIQLLGAEVEKHLVPIETVLPSDEALSEQFAKDFVGGELPIKPVEDIWRTSIPNGRFGFFVKHEVNRKEYEKAVKKGTVAADLFGSDGKARHHQPALDAFIDSIDPDQRLVTIQAQFERQHKVLGRFYVKLFEDIVGPEELETILEAFEFTAAPAEGEPGVDDHRVTILNLTDTPMDPSELCKFAEALRLVANATSGRINEYFDVLAILPTEHSSMITTFKRKDGQLIPLPRNGYQSENSIALSEQRLLLLPPDQVRPIPEEAGELLDSYLEQGEVIEGSPAAAAAEVVKKIRRTVGEGEIFATFLHELMHIAMLGMIPPSISKEAIDPSLYARINAIERAAEVWVAICLGREVSVEDMEAFLKTWTEVAARRERYGHPTGPFVVTGREIDLTSPLSPTRRTNESLDTQFEYELV